MERGFIPLVVIAIIGLVSVLTASGGYAVYKYSQVSKEKEAVETKLDEQRELELEQLREKVEGLETKDGSATTTEEVVEDKESPKITEQKTEPNHIPVVSKLYVPSPVKEDLLPVVTTIQTGINYHSQVTQDVKRIIALNESFKDWLNDTEGELRDARKTLNGFPSGGLVGKLRDSNLKLVEAELGVASVMISSVNESLAYWEGFLSVLNANPTEFVNQESYERSKAPDVVEKEIYNIKKDMNSTLESINEGIQAINNAMYSL